MNKTIKESIKEMLLNDSKESGIAYLDLLHDFTTSIDLADEFDLSISNINTITNELAKEYEAETHKEAILNAIINSDMKECIDMFNGNLSNKDDINKIDLFWLEQLKVEVSNAIIRAKEFNKL